MANLMLDVVTYLTSNAVVTGDGVDAFRDFAPESPDDAVIVYEYASGTPIVHDTAAQRSLQIVARSLSADTARAKALEIYSLFQPNGDKVSLTYDRWALCAPKQTPFKVKIDEQRRLYYGFNMSVVTYND